MGNDKVLQNGRVYYVEPNDVYGNDDFSVVPYEDLCIAFNLSAEVYSRDGVKRSTHEWSIEYNGQKAERRFGFLQGMGEHGKDISIKSDENATFLTTYYTDISGDDVANRQNVESLGVESISISYENYYAPRIQIKFIDVRGAALFGREEAIHAAGGELTGENVFGVFFTIPYPKFKLQVKGFYGKPVTFQLTCESFKGNFNASNGNFEANVTFIGYQYSMLTDIPMRYLIAAPFNEQYGLEYWNEHVNCEAWRLDDGSAPPKLFDFVNSVKTALISEESKAAGLDAEDAIKMKEYSDYRTELNTVKSAYDTFVSALQSSDRNGGAVNVIYESMLDGDSGGHEQILLMYSQGDVADKSLMQEQLDRYSIDNAYSSDRNDGYSWLTQSRTNSGGEASGKYRKEVFIEGGYAVNEHDSLIDILEEYNSGVSQENIKTRFDKTLFPNGRSERWNGDIDFKAVRLVQKSVDKDGKTTITFVSGNSVVANEFNNEMPVSVNGIVMTEGLKRKVRDFLSNEKNLLNVGEYWVLVDLKELGKMISEGIRDCTARIDAIMNKPSEKDSFDINSVLKFKPTIGNIFRIVMCHLETFCHILYEMGNEVEGKRRTPDSTGLSIDFTDYVSMIGRDGAAKNIVYGPWPGAYNYGYESRDGGEIQTEIKRRGWVGEMNGHPFIDEENVVLGFIKAVQQVGEDMNITPEKAMRGSDNKESLPLLPMDILKGANYFPTLGNDISEAKYLSILGGELGIRSAQIFGVFESGRINDGNFPEIARRYGKLDAINYYISLGSADALNRFVLSGETSDLDRKLLDIMLCRKGGQEYAVNCSGLSGEKRHDFETASVGMQYSQTRRHPIYVDNGNGKYVYCHYYDKNGNSLVPSELAIDYYKAYNNWFRVEKNGENDVVCKAQTKDYGKGYKNGECVLYNSCDAPVEGYDSGKYLNNSMFEVVTNPQYVEMLHDIKKDDRTTYIANDTEITISDLKQLFDDHWKNNDDGFVKQLKNYGCDMFGTSMSASFIGKKNNYAKSYLGLDSNEVRVNTFGSDSSIADYKQGDCYIHELKIGSDSLFAHPLYYAQEKNDRSKWILLLHALKYNKPSWKFMSGGKKFGTLESVPKGLMLLYGGLLWRQKNGEVINSTVGEITYRGIDRNKTLFRKDGTFDAQTKDPEYMSIREFFGADYNDLDSRYANKLIATFLDFTGNDSYESFRKLEIKRNINGKKFLDLKNHLFTVYNEKYNLKHLEHRGGQADEMLADIRNNTDIFKKGDLKTFKYNEFVNLYLGIGLDYDKKSINLIINDDMSISDVSEIQNRLTNLYTGEYVFLDMSGTFHRKGDTAGGRISIPSNVLSSYLKGFKDTLEEINLNNGNINNAPHINKPSGELNGESSTNELAIDIYYYLKNIWDKWLLQHYKADDSNGGQEYFNVSEFFNKNFIFIDKFYIDVANKLMCNAKRVIDAITDIYSNRDASLYSFLSQICSDHGCLLFAMPDYINYGGDLKKGIEAVSSLFKAYPYEGIGAPREENMFVVMYADKPADTTVDKNGYACDGFDIKLSDGQTDTDTLPMAFKAVPVYDGTNGTSLHGYGVPAFGVEFGRQKQSIFKSIDVNMNNPMTTAISIQTTTDIAEMGKNTARKVVFQGQDVFSIYNSYSYECEVEMMGNAQIMPMMYFQLMNVPMWHGAYMIMKVNHTITPGNMITKFTGQKMSKICTPWCSTYATKAKDSASRDGNSGNLGTLTYGSDGKIIMPSYPPVHDYSEYDNIIPCNEYSQGRFVNEAYTKALEKYMYHTNGVYSIGNYAPRCELVKMYLAFKDEFESATDGKYSILVTNSVRSIGGKSEHEGNDASPKEYKANAMDINLCSKKSPTTQFKDYALMFKFVDIVLTNHFNDIGQMILEVRGSNTLSNGTYQYRTPDGYKCVHISCGNKRSDRIDGNQKSPNVWIANIGDQVATVSTLAAAEMLAEEFLAIAGKWYWVLGRQEFKNRFWNFRLTNDNEYDVLFADYKPSTKGTNIPSESADKYGVADSNVFKSVQRYLGIQYSN